MQIVRATCWFDKSGGDTNNHLYKSSPVLVQGDRFLSPTALKEKEMSACASSHRAVCLMHYLLVVSFVAGAFSSHSVLPQVSGRRKLQSQRILRFTTPQNHEVPKMLKLEAQGETVETDAAKNISETTNAEPVVSEMPRRRHIVAATFLSGLTILSSLAKLGVLRGPFDPAVDTYTSYTNRMIGQDVGLTLLAAALAYALVKVISLGCETELYGSKVSRKLTHILSAPLFVLFYPFFSAADGSRFFAGLVILTNMVRLYLAGTGFDEGLAKSVSRSGDKSEALGGPFIYVCLFQAFTLLFWRSSVIGVVAISTMAAGDGMADLVGRKWGRTNKWWFSKDKSVAGSAAFTIASTVTSYGLVQLFMATGCYDSLLPPLALLLRIAGISVACAVIELLPIGDDNYTVPLSAAILTAMLIH
eukprot:scaffold5024_cov136-Cylindrotheca_fusiformis.AAC.10